MCLCASALVYLTISPFVCVKTCSNIEGVSEGVRERESERAIKRSGFARISLNQLKLCVRVCVCLCEKDGMNV